MLLESLGLVAYNRLDSEVLASGVSLPSCGTKWVKEQLPELQPTHSGLQNLELVH